MDAWDDDFREPTRDEMSARRILALAVALINARRPLSTVELHREFYPQTTDNTFRTMFLRDRERLAIAGLVLRQGPKVDDASTWVVDGESSFVKENLLSEQDALVLSALLLPLATDPSYPYSRDLRLALSKIDRSFDGTSMATIPPEARMRNANVSRLEDCMSASHLARISYRRADGSQVKRTVAPLGFFHLNGTTYMVASAEDGQEAPHTYNLNRVHTVREQARSSFTRPPDFDIRDFILLPFQIGEALYQATFVDDEGTERSESVSDESMAASWAIAEGLTPIRPASLVRAWREILWSWTKESPGDQGTPDTEGVVEDG